MGSTVTLATVVASTIATILIGAFAPYFQQSLPFFY